jgi:uncharacterized membrane protein YqjE
MDARKDSPPRLAEASKQLARQALVICENRVELALVEAQEECDQMLRVFWLSLGVAVFILLAGVALSLAVAVACWQWSPLAALLVIAALYAAIAMLLSGQLSRLRRGRRSFPATMDELRKDRECLEKKLN